MLSILGLVVAVLLVSLVTAIALYYHSYDGRVYHGVYAFNMDMSGHTQADAQKILESRFAQYATTPVTIHYLNQVRSVTPDELGVRFDSEKASASVYGYGRRGDVLTQVQEQANLLFGRYDAVSSLSVDPAAETQLLQSIAAQIDRPAKNAALVIKQEGDAYKIDITPAQSALRVDVARTLAAWKENYVPLTTGELNVVVDEQPAAITEADLHADQLLSQQLVDQPFVMAYNNRFWPFFSSMMADMLTFVPQPGDTQKMQVMLDQQKLRTHIAWLASQIDHPAKDATIRIDGTRVILEPSVDSETVDQDATIAAMQAAVQNSAQPVPVVVKRESPKVTTADLLSRKVWAEAILAQPMVISYGDKTYTFSKEQMAAAITFNPDDSVKLSLDQQKLQQYVASLAKQIDHPGKDAQIRLDGTKVVVDPAVESETVDQSATVSALSSALLQGEHTLNLLVKREQPQVSDGDLAQAKASAEAYLASQLLLTFEGHTYTFSKERIAAALEFSKATQNGKTVYAATLKQQPLKDWIAAIAEDIDRSPHNAAFWYVNGQVQVVRESQQGVAVDMDNTLARVNAQAPTGNHTVELQVKTVKPQIDASDRASIQFPNKLWESSTSYAGSIPPRAHNVELAASKLDGALIAPGQTFSFNQYLGPQTIAAGFQVGYGIVATNRGGVQTVPSVGGGICQVASTLYHTIFWSGLPIVERHYHLYYIDRYDSMGLKGMDATVDDAGGVDFQFQNTSGHWLLIRSYTDGDAITFQLYGTDPGWKVVTSSPAISNYVRTSQQMIYQKDPTIPAGQSIVLEHAEDGFTVDFTRYVYSGNTLLSQQRFVSDYRPAHNVTAVGTGK